jgi:hypothetical protein
MSLTVHHIHFIASVKDALPEIRVLLGDDWPLFSNPLLELLELLIREDDAALCEDIFNKIVVHMTSISRVSPPAGKLLRETCAPHSDCILTTGSAIRFNVWDTEPNLEIGELDGSRFPSMREPTLIIESRAARDDFVKISQSLANDLKTITLEKKEKATRYFNTFFTSADGQTIIADTEPLVWTIPYRLCVEINPEYRGLGDQKEAFPDGALDEAQTDKEALSLLVVAASRDFEIKPQVRRIELPREGPSSMVRFSVRPFFSGRRGFLLVDIFYRGHLLQSKRVEAFAVANASDEVPVTLRPLQTARVTFTTTDRFTSDTVALMPERVLTIEVERDERDQSVDLRFLDRTRGEEELAYYDTTLEPLSLGKAITAVRERLEAAIKGEVRDKQPIAGYEWILSGDDALLRNWLPYLADVGRSLYRKLLPESQRDSLQDRGERLKAALQPGAVIQINPIFGKVTIPWALLYERPVRLIPGQMSICEKYVEAGPDCPDCLSRQDPTVICPYAFWGFRYAIEQLPCWVGAELPQPLVLVRRIANGRPLLLNLNIWDGFKLWGEHKKKLDSAGQVTTLLAKQLNEMVTAWQQHGTELDIVYFYTHGGIHNQQPYLEVSDGKIMSNFLESCGLNWPHHPLVFLNGCSTGNYGPESFVSLIDDFRKAGASGVIGTECAVSEMIAEGYATELFPKLFRGERLGQAMLEVRRDFLLKKKNPLGLVYSLYASSEISLASPV